MSPNLALVALLSCSPHPLSLDQAKQLVLAAPNIQASVKEHGAKPFFEWVDPGRAGWSFTVKANNPCQNDGPCSNLLGRYFVNRQTAQVFDLDAGEDGQIVSGAALRALQTRLGCTTPPRPAPGPKGRS